MYREIIEVLDAMPAQAAQRPELPVLITARFEKREHGAALLSIASNNAPSIFITVIHEGRGGIHGKTMRGDQTGEPFIVRDAESVLIIARHEGRIIAGAMLEVDIALPESIDMLLLPVAATNIVIDQHNVVLTERAINGALQNAVDLDETVKVEVVR